MIWWFVWVLFVWLLRLSTCPLSSDFSLYCSYIPSLCCWQIALIKLFSVPSLLMKMLKTRWQWSLKASVLTSLQLNHSSFSTTHNVPPIRSLFTYLNYVSFLIMIASMPMEMHMILFPCLYPHLQWLDWLSLSLGREENKLEHGKLWFITTILLLCKCEVSPKLCDHRCCGISILGHARESMGHGPEQPALIRSALSWWGRVWTVE